MKEAIEQLNEEFGIGLSEEEIQSIAVQIVGKSFDEATVLQVAHATSSQQSGTRENCYCHNYEGRPS
jgi:hypothetical protein